MGDFGIGETAPARVFNAQGQSPFVLACDHATNHIPEQYGTLGLSPHQRLLHIAWDPGALGVALELSELLDAPLVASTVSRLVVDCNRATDAPDLVATISERTEVPGNLHVGEAERQDRVARFHTPFHDAVSRQLDSRVEAGREAILVSVHSFTPVYKDVWRPWPIGLITPQDPRFSQALFDALRTCTPGLLVGWNEPYSAHVGVTYTLEHHGDRRGIASSMIEIRHDEILGSDGIALWAGRLAEALQVARVAVENTVAA
jgi:predicted N-formylglutamate amidohydrolase